MTMYDFQLLPEQLQIETLYRNGVYIGKQKRKLSIILLYQLESFYVEVFYHPVDNEIKRLRSFKSVDQLQPYLDKIAVQKWL